MWSDKSGRAGATLRAAALAILGQALAPHAFRTQEAALTRLGGPAGGPGKLLDDTVVVAETRGREGAKVVHVQVFEDPLSVWGTLSRTGRTSWRWPSQRRKAPEPHAPAVLVDWWLPCSAVSMLLLLHVSLSSFPRSWALHVGGLAAGVAVAGFYLAALCRRHGSDYSVLWLTGYLLEFINNVENIFIFHCVCKAWRTPPEHSRKAMSFVMLSQVLVQAVCYLGVADSLRRVTFLPYVVGVWLLYAGYSLVTVQDDALEYELADTWLVSCLRKCLGARFSPSYSAESDVFVVKDGQLIVTLLGPVACLLVVLNIGLEADVTLTKIEEIPVQQAALSSSVLCSFLMPEFFFVAGELFQRARKLRFGIGSVTAFYGAQMVLGDFVVVPAAWSCFIMVAVVLLCLLLGAAEGSGGGGGGEEPLFAEGAEPAPPPSQPAERAHDMRL